MSDLTELLARRASLTDTELLRELRDGLAASASDSGAAAPLHALLQGYFALNRMASDSSFAAAFESHRDTTQQLLAVLAEDGLDKVAQLVRSLAAGLPQPTGALETAVRGTAATEAGQHGAAVQAAFEAFARVALASPGSQAELELSLAWCEVEAALVDRVARQADALAFAHGPTYRETAARAQSLDDLVARHDLPTLLAGLAAAPRPRLLARPSEWAIDKEGAPADWVEVAVEHRFHLAAPGPVLELKDGPAAQALRQFYAFANGAELFVPLAHIPGEPGLRLIADDQWEAERELVMTWLTMGTDESDLPAWAHSLVPIAALNGDASRWVVPIEGPFAGAVMLSNDDVLDEHVRYKSLAHFVAALRLCPQQVLGNGGYVSYVVPEHDHLLYPQGYAEGDG